MKRARAKIGPPVLPAVAPAASVVRGQAALPDLAQADLVGASAVVGSVAAVVGSVAAVSGRGPVAPPVLHAIGPQISALPRRRDDSAARRASNRNTSRAAQSRKRPAAAFTTSTISRKKDDSIEIDNFATSAPKDQDEGVAAAEDDESDDQS